jgi:hypothetical protein
MPLEYKRALQEMKLRDTERQLAAVRQEEEQLEVRSDG